MLELLLGVAMLAGVYLYGVRVGVRGGLRVGEANGRAAAESEYARMMENGMAPDPYAWDA